MAGAASDDARAPAAASTWARYDSRSSAMRRWQAATIASGLGPEEGSIEAPPRGVADADDAADADDDVVGPLVAFFAPATAVAFCC